MDNVPTVTELALVAVVVVIVGVLVILLLEQNSESCSEDSDYCESEPLYNDTWECIEWHNESICQKARYIREFIGYGVIE